MNMSDDAYAAAMRYHNANALTRACEERDSAKAALATATAERDAARVEVERLTAENERLEALFQRANGMRCHSSWVAEVDRLKVQAGAASSGTPAPTFAGKCDNCGHEGPFALVAGPPINGGLCDTCARPKESGVCASWCGTPGLGGRGRDGAYYTWDGPDRDACTDYCTVECQQAGRSLHPAPGTAR